MKEILYAVNIGSVRIFCFLSFILEELNDSVFHQQLNLTTRVGSAAAMTTFKVVFAAYFFTNIFQRLLMVEFFTGLVSHGRGQLIAEMVSNSNAAAGL